jgi:Binding-protein-dependent transport system inner membrane component
MLVYLGGTLGVNAWLLGFFNSIPIELDESARVDGASAAQIFWGVVLPLGAPVLAVIGLLSFVSTLNEVIIASQLLQAPKKYTSPSACTAPSGIRSASSWARLHRPRRAPRGADLHRPATVDRRRPHPGRGEGMTTARCPLAVVGETMFPRRAPFFSRAWGTSRFPTPLPAPHGPVGP